MCETRLRYFWCKHHEKRIRCALWPNEEYIFFIGFHGKVLGEKHEIILIMMLQTAPYFLVEINFNQLKINRKIMQASTV